MKSFRCTPDDDEQAG